MTMGTSIWGLPASSRSVRRGAGRSTGRCRFVDGNVAGRGVRRTEVGRRAVRSDADGIGVIEDRAWVGRADGGVGLRLFVGDGTRRIFEVRQGGVLGMVAQPLVDERLDHPAPTERATDERPAALGLEVAQQALVTRVLLTTTGDLGLDLLLGDLEPLGVGDAGEYQERLDPTFRVRPELGVEVVVRLLGGLEVGLLGDALPCDGAA